MTRRSVMYLLVGLALIAGAWARACSGGACPSIAALSNYDPDQASKVYAADGRLLTDFGLQRRTVVTLRDMSPAVTAAFLSVEDKRFYQHHGVDWVRVFASFARVPKSVLTGRPSRRASAIDRQVDPGDERGFVGGEEQGRRRDVLRRR